MKAAAVLTIGCVLFLCGCGREAPAPGGPAGPASLKVTSAAFAQGEMMPARFTADGENVSPPLEWGGAPESTRSFVLIVDDPDAPRGTFTHWLVADLPGDTTSLSPDASGNLPSAAEGRNDFGVAAYRGPAPPGGETHRYYFRLYALDAELGLDAGFSRGRLEQQMEGHVLAQGELMGRYRRQ